MTPPIRALLIEDNAALADATAALLRREGFDVRTALSAHEGLEAAADFKPQLTLCDLYLPDMLGTDVIRKLRSNPLTRNTYAVILTALSGQEIPELNAEAGTMGIDEFVPKPLLLREVRRLVTKLMG